MPDNKPAAETPKTTEADIKKAADHLKAIKDKIFSFSGKPGHNPYMLWSKKYAELEKQFEANPATHAVAVLALKFEEPKV